MRTVPLARQTPTRDEVFLDHLAHFVPDMSAAEAALERLGFTLTPYTEQRNRTPAGMIPAGTANRCAMLRNGYLEFLTRASDTPLARRLEAALSRYTGVHLLAMSVADADRAAARLASAGFAPDPVVNLTREVADADGRAAQARFSVLRVAPETMPEGRIQILTHHTEALVWQERWLAHRNGIVSLEAVLVAVADPPEAAHRFARFLDRAPRRLDPERWIVSLDRGALVFAPDARPLEGGAGSTPRDLPAIVGYALGAPNPEDSASIMAAGGAAPARPASRDERALRLPVELGGAVVLVAPGAAPAFAR